MPTPTLITVPCACGAALSLGQPTCPSCHAPLSPALRDALDARLESAHADYREARQQVSRAAVLLLVLGALHLLAALFIGFLGGSTLSPLIASNAGIGLAFLACWRAAKHAPVPAMAAALAVWAAVRLALFLLAPAEILLSFTSAGGIITLMAKIAVFVVLVRAVLAARSLHAVRESLARGSAASEAASSEG